MEIGSPSSQVDPASTETPGMVGRTILVKSDNSTIHLIFPKSTPVLTFMNLPVIATGYYSSCSQTLNLKETNNVEVFK